MARNFYLDTAIWRDYFEDRADGLRPLGEFAFRFLKNCEKHGCKVFVSALVIRELRKGYSKEQIAMAFSPFKNTLQEVPVSNEQISEARKILSSVTGAHLMDVVHAVLARDNQAIMITRDKHFDSLLFLVEVSKPEDFYF